MAAGWFVSRGSNRLCRSFFSQPIFLAFTSSVLFFIYISKLQNQHAKNTDPQTNVRTAIQQYHDSKLFISQEPNNGKEKRIINLHESIEEGETSSSLNGSLGRQHKPKEKAETGSTGYDNNKFKDVFHDRDLFRNEYDGMNRSLKIYVYPHETNDTFANILLPVDAEPQGNYASESYFKKSLFRSHFLTNNALEADLFYLPFSIAGLRNDKRVGVGRIQDFIKSYIRHVSQNYPYWNRTGGADHFYVACHSVGRSAMEKAIEVRLNAIQVVCSSSYFVSTYVAHKDASIPQIWPRNGKRPMRLPSERKKLVFYAGAMNSRVREFLVRVWKNDNDVSVHQRRLKTPYSEALLGSKYCIHAKGFEVNTARIADALYYGCVPVVLADHYDLPYTDILNWDSFSVVVSTEDIPMLKKILQGISYGDYLKLQRNVMRVQKHFQWHQFPLDFDAFYMVMYELWIRRNHVRISLNSL
ncbi:probable glycosyltransferase At5g03795 [Andrographis paniculata]|uniref:probable glycosyltransferase At5g03795 n=1 Tax=Andrographis paniculata TaxID=175694 RepID=UPI0021E90129|nr:probable glycosyltransferase At5g03795 [Andrographis paniculata]